MDEKEKLENISRNHSYSKGIMVDSISYCFNILTRHLKGKSILELGPAEGLMTELLIKITEDLTIVEGSKTYSDSLSIKYPKIKVFNNLFENFEPNRKFDTIILGHVLEHVEEPIELLIKIKSWLNDDGIIFCTVPNAESLHRQAAVLMGILESNDTLNNSDIIHGHRRVFSPDLFKSVFNKAELEIIKFGGYWLKPLSNLQIENDWTQQMIDAFMKLGEQYPQIAGEIYIIAK